MIHYPIPPHLQPAYQELGFTDEAFPLAEAMSRDLLSLPIGPHMPMKAVKTVAGIITGTE